MPEGSLKIYFSFRGVAHSILMLNLIFDLQGLNPGKAIAELKRLLSGLHSKPAPALDTAALHNK